MHIAQYWEKQPQSIQRNTVRCFLCPRNCFIQEGKKGFCQVRVNNQGTLYFTEYGKISSLALDPIEKKPLFHFYPGEKIVSFGTVGCNLRCKYCQNWEISQETEHIAKEVITPQALVALAKEQKIPMIAATYNDPIIMYEYLLDVFKEAKKAGIKTVIVSNGFINPEPLAKLIPYFDAANIDLKGFSNKFYTQLTTAWLEPILQTIKTLYHAGIWLELTNLLIPGQNDSDKMIKELIIWVKKELSPEVPLHFTAFYPMYQMLDVPPTPKESLIKAWHLAKEQGMHYVYVGNVHDERTNTYCPQCNALLIKREGYHTKIIGLSKGKCKQCSMRILGIFEE